MESNEGTHPADQFWRGRHAAQPLDVLVIGAGITGLSIGVGLAKTGHSVTILESVSQISEVGAGLQIAPNACRVLRRLGIMSEISNHMSVLSRVSSRRYNSDDEMCTTPMMPILGERYEAPMGVIHRGDLQRVLLVAAQDAGCKILTSHAVTSVDVEYNARVRVLDRKTGQESWITGDVLLSADGVKSTVRGQMAKEEGYSDIPIPTGDSAYRLLIPREKVAENKLLLSMLDDNAAIRYMGPYGHVMAYPVKQNTVLNIVMLHPDKRASSEMSDDVWTQKGSRDEMIEFYKEWSPAIQGLMKLAEEHVLEWTLKTQNPLPRWCRGSVALAGDACHPMLPYVAQGAANGIEDAGVLAAAFTCTSDVQTALGVYELVRKERAERIADSAAATRGPLHLPNGPEQEKRDEIMIAAAAGVGSNVDKWQDRKWQDFMWGTDVMRETVENWDDLVKEARAKELISSSSLVPTRPSSWFGGIFKMFSWIWNLCQSFWRLPGK